jgi:putative oxidoreductase
MFPWYAKVGGAGSLGLLVLRLAAGAAFILHGSAKIHDDTGWHFETVTTWMNKMPNPPPPYLQAAAIVAELGGGMAWVLGFLTPLFSFMIACTMATAFAMVHYPHGDAFVSTKPGDPSFELTAVYFATAVCLLLCGPGQLSLDHCLFGRRRSTTGLPPYVGR